MGQPKQTCVLVIMARINYSDEDIAEFLELAQDIGIGRAIRQLGYPNSWGTAQRWAQARGIKVEVDDLKARSKSYHDWYTTEETLLVAQQGMSRVYEQLQEAELDPDEQKKLADAFQKYANTWLLLQGKANNISERRESTQADLEIVELLRLERAKQSIESTVVEAIDVGPTNIVDMDNAMDVVDIEAVEVEQDIA